MARRTKVEDYKKVIKAEDLDRVVVDKREGKRANKKKAKRRNRHYSKTLLRHMASDMDSEKQSEQ